MLAAELLKRGKRLEGDVGGFISVTGGVGEVDERMVAETEVFFVFFRMRNILWVSFSFFFFIDTSAVRRMEFRGLGRERETGSMEVI